MQEKLTAGFFSTFNIPESHCSAFPYKVPSNLFMALFKVMGSTRPLDSNLDLCKAVKRFLVSPAWPSVGASSCLQGAFYPITSWLPCGLVSSTLTSTSVDSIPFFLFLNSIWKPSILLFMVFTKVGRWRRWISRMPV